MRWTGTCSSKGFALMGLGFTLIYVALSGFYLLTSRNTPTPGWVGWLLVFVGLFIGVSGYVLSSLRVEVTDEAVAVRFGPTGWPQRRIPIDQIEAAEAIMVDPLKWGGWGYRWMPWAKASAAVIRKGPGIELQLKDGRRFAVTVNDSVAGAQTISALCSN